MVKTMSESENKMSYICRILLKLEAWINTIIAFIFGLPILISIHGYKTIIFIIFNTIPWVVERMLVPAALNVFELIAVIWDNVIFAIKTILKGIVWMCKKVRYVLSIINWCAVRSIIRIVSTITGVASISYIIYASIGIYGTVKIITGYFYDKSPTIYAIHIAILVFLLSVSFYYNAWAYSNSEESTFVCKYTWGFQRFKDFWNRKRGSKYEL